jgi:hexokinase
MIITSYGHIFEKTFKTGRKRYSLLVILTMSAIFETIFEHMVSMFQEMGDVLRRILLSSLVQTNIMNRPKQKRTRN